jgi:hypothetical protein
MRKYIGGAFTVTILVAGCQPAGRIAQYHCAAPVVHCVYPEDGKLKCDCLSDAALAEAERSK